MSEYKTEASKCSHLIEKYCKGLSVDIGSQGAATFPWMWSLDLPKDEFAYYNSNNPPRGPIQLRGHADKLPIDDNSLDALLSSHLLEDYEDWSPCLKEWVRVIKPGGYLIVLIPDRELWCKACANGQPPNDFHRHEGKVGELSTYADALGVEVIEDRLTNCPEGDYGIMFVARKKSPLPAG